MPSSRGPLLETLLKDFPTEAYRMFQQLENSGERPECRAPSPLGINNNQRRSWVHLHPSFDSLPKLYCLGERDGGGKPAQALAVSPCQLSRGRVGAGQARPCRIRASTQNPEPLWLPGPVYNTTPPCAGDRPHLHTQHTPRTISCKYRSRRRAYRVTATMDIPIITTQSYFDEPEETPAKRKRPRGKYEFRGSQSHRCSLVAVCEADTGRTTVKWSSVRVGREARRNSTCTKTNSANGGLSLTSPTLGDPAALGKEVVSTCLFPHQYIHVFTCKLYHKNILEKHSVCDYYRTKRVVLYCLQIMADESNAEIFAHWGRICIAFYGSLPRFIGTL
ncbi:hypothetical protein J6590_008015 [Homalodisca vitripennis]|nr:hypothetical protein J6590_008015 [Homalodisca vitripennis]